ncbi:tetratricopeptide repeat protein [Marinoscillum sp.]|uniref:tetratricopeptide repeat protein n=1 Tax=Marinoscillum sp. TaxID=2024838 RepID=UPI003BAC87C6
MLDRLITEIRTSIRSGNSAIFCGAGISYNSGLPLATDLVKKILESIDIKGKDAVPILNSNMPFEFFMETIFKEVSIDEILDIFKMGEPNANHELIAELLKGGFINTVVTTNFDQLIEKALENIGLHRGSHFEVYSSEEEFGSVNWSDQTIKIIKLHGCISKKDEVAITLDLVANKTFCINKNQIIKEFFTRDIHPNVIVIGYSCSDLFDISPQIEIVNENTSKVFFIQHVNNTEEAIEDISLSDHKNPFKSFTGKRISIDTDNFTKEIWTALILRQYKFINPTSISWTHNIDNWVSQAIATNSIGIKHHLPARWYYDIGEYQYSAQHCEQGMIIAQNLSNQITFYSELGNLGMAFNALGKYKEARSCLEESVRACHDLGNLQGEIAQLQSLGNIYRNLGEFNSAIDVYTKAASMAALKGDLDDRCTSLGNLATVFNQTDQPDQAIKCLNEGLKLAKQVGNKQSEGSMLCSLGISYAQKGNLKKAFEYVNQSLDTTRLIGDRQGECMALLNLSNLHLYNKDFDECLAISLDSLKIARLINSRQNEAGSSYIIGSSYFFKGDIKLAIKNLKNAIKIYTDIYGIDHRHTQVAIKALTKAENFPG